MSTPASLPGDAPWLGVAGLPAAGAASEAPAWPVTDSALPAATRLRKGPPGRNWFVGLVVVPLISYAILATIVMIIQYLRLRELSHPEAPPSKPSPEHSGNRE